MSSRASTRAPGCAARRVGAAESLPVTRPFSQLQVNLPASAVDGDDRATAVSQRPTAAFSAVMSRAQ